MPKRIEQVNSLIKREISQILLREFEFSQNVLATITRVETSANLIESNIWISVIPEKETAEIVNSLNRKVYFLQQKLNKRLKMRPIPKIRFLAEEKTREAGQIEEILERLKK